MMWLWSNNMVKNLPLADIIEKWNQKQMDQNVDVECSKNTRLLLGFEV